MTIHLLPIEPFEERYTEQWYRWWKQDLEAENHIVNIIDGVDISSIGEREGGEWLDPTKTWIWKGRQLENLARAFHNKEIKDGDTILSLDMWNPCLTGALYMRDTTKVRVKIGAFYHAGASDPNDFLSRMGCRKWALDVERGWIKGIDFVLCGSDFAAKMLKTNLSLLNASGAKIYAVGYPIKQLELIDNCNYIEWNKRDRIVVFPHRLAPEKQPHLFKELEKQYFEIFGDDGTKFIRTRDVCSNKKEYYDTLAKSRVSVSLAKQETFGIAQQEASALGCWVLNPMCCSYPEVTRGTGLLYKPYDLKEMAIKLKELLDKKTNSNYSEYNEKAIRRASDVINNMSTILPSDNKSIALHESQDFWTGGYRSQKALFINSIPTDYTGSLYFNDLEKEDIECLVFCGNYSFDNEKHRLFFYQNIDKYDIVVIRNYGEHTCLLWQDIYSEFKNKIEVIHRVHFQYDIVGELEIGESFNSKVFIKSEDSNKKYDYARW